MKYDNAIRLQKEVEKKIVAEDDFGLIDRVCGVDIAYSGYNGDVAYCFVGVMERDWEFVESVDVETRVTHPYVAGLLMLREAGPILCALDMPKSD